ncbi:MAG: ATP-binding cassette, subfamily beta-glucan exporter [Variibacter sp.]|jgi:ATP-binding cassette subfamily B protein|nr:ATP-binding cassette, subfamily beta-glucan exporter [Variibacter sp.]
MHFVRLYLRVLGLLGGQARLAWALSFANLALAASQFAEPILFGKVIDTLTRAQTDASPDNWSRLIWLLALWVGFGLFTILCSTLVALYADRLAHQQRHVAIASYFAHVLQLPLSYHGGTHSGRLMKVMLQGTDSLWSLWVGFFRDHLSVFVSFFVLLPLSLFMNWRLALLLIALTCVFAVLTVFVMRKTEAMQGRVEEHFSELAERASDTLGNVALVHSFARVEAEVSGLKQVIDRLLAAQIPVLSWWAMIAVLTRAATTVTILSIIIYGATLNFRGLATVGDIVTFMAFAGLLIDRLQHAVGFTNRIFTEAPRLYEFFDVLDTVPAVRDRTHAIDPGRLRGLVEFKNVSFSYDGRRSAVLDVSFTALPGETIAFVGTTGAGKSTALALLYRSFDPQSGAILIDGMDIRDMTLNALRRDIGVVFQEGLLFNRSIGENLRIGKPDATDEELRDAAARAQALEFVEKDEAGFDARVGERGRLLSGGERQRLSIARALLKDPPILILDEATSALDARTERLVMTALDEVMKGRTTFVIAHRLATIRKADRILLFQNGRVVESGTFDELVRVGGQFAELARAQYMTPETSPEELPKPALPVET